MWFAGSRRFPRRQRCGCVVFGLGLRACAGYRRMYDAPPYPAALPSTHQGRTGVVRCSETHNSRFSSCYRQCLVPLRLHNWTRLHLHIGLYICVFLYSGEGSNLACRWQSRTGQSNCVIAPRARGPRHRRWCLSVPCIAYACVPIGSNSRALLEATVWSNPFRLH